ncbi:hypothetical protein PHYPSEUDO_014787 [Phytophthora pseudosyringae]|uniref:Uncharacterized protein n=1 Tax=Phytophthora pseudosyringae TaxID=221518 RepID=A0A8T1V791_9STRA|nr:hypothetical protein PHYPSEUDO_014787 [Phytophthora pseudosyringae]
MSDLHSGARDAGQSSFPPRQQHDVHEKQAAVLLARSRVAEIEAFQENIQEMTEYRRKILAVLNDILSQDKELVLELSSDLPGLTDAPYTPSLSVLLAELLRRTGES